MIESKLCGKVALITGASRGIGRAIALRLAEEGAHVAIVYAGNEAAAEATAREAEQTGARALCIKCDVSSGEQAARAVKQARECLGPIDILVNNAGVTRDGLALRLREDDFRRVLDVNLTGAFLMTKAAMGDMVRRRAGRIINITSVAGLMGNIGQVNYASAKAGMIGLTKTVARELAGRGVTVNAVAPGYVKTDMTSALEREALERGIGHVPLGRMAEACEIAETVAFLAGERAAYITGAVIQVDGGLYM